jgi:hypothetical protein
MLKKLFGISKGLRIFGEGEVDVIEGSADPTVSPGREAPQGTLYLRHNGISYKKTGPEDTDWVKASTTSTAGTGFLYILNVTPQSTSDNVGSKEYVPDTTPPNTVLTECTSDTANVTIEFLAEGGVHYSPTVTLNGTTCSNLEQYGTDRRLFHGSFDVTLSVVEGESEDFILESSTDQSTSVTVTLGGAGPEITNISFGSYPGSQTALKYGDVIDVTVTVENDAVSCWIEDDKASNNEVSLTLGAVDGAGAGYRYATGTITISNVATDAPVDAQASNDIGTAGSVYTSSNLTIDQDSPVITYNSTTYPAGQGALKDSEGALINVTVSDFDGITYSSPTNELSIPDTTTYEQTKTVTRIAGSYNDDTNNYRIVATKSSNDTSTTRQYVVIIANVAAQLSISLPASRLRTGGDGYSNVGLTTLASIAEHTITINSNQQLDSVPTLADPDADKGIWVNGSFTNAGGMTSFTNDLEIDDDSTRGTHDWGAISGTNLSGLTTTVITGTDTYEIGGFMPRYYELVLGQNSVSGDVEVTNYTDVTLDWQYKDGSGQVKALSRNSVINESPPVTNSWTIDTTGSNPTTFIILDTAATQAQTVNTAVLVEEEV